MDQRDEKQTVAHNLPQPLSPFIGRREEVAQIVALLDEPSCRLLTLIGVGGSGKTRLAIEAAKHKLEDFHDGVYFVNLQPLSDADFIAPAIIETLDVALSAADDPSTLLSHYVHEKEMLLVLDNFEDLMEGAALLTKLLHAAPNIKLLVTSRQALNLQEEWTRPIAGLDFPERAQAADATSSDAVQMFMECARRASGNLALQDEGAHVTRICRLVEGMPLAIELAASWTRTLPCAVIADQIQHNLDFLVTNLRNIPDRHRSIQAVFEQSWQLLDEEERRVFQRLSIFRGGFRWEAAEAIAEGSLGLLSGLIDKSLLRLDANGRFQIHELLRQYAEENLAQSPELVVHVKDSHAAYYANFLDERLDDLKGGRQEETTVEIAADLENIRVAWQWALERLRADDVEKSCHPLYLFFQYQSRYREAAEIFARALRAFRQVEVPEAVEPLLAQLLCAFGWINIRLGHFQEARAALEENHRICIRHKITTVFYKGKQIDARLPLGVLAATVGDYEEADRLGEQLSQKCVGSDGNLIPYGSFAFYLQAISALALGQYEKARRFALESCRIAKEAEDRWFMAYALNELGNVASALGNYERAKEHYQESYALREAFDDPEGKAVALNHLGRIARLQNRYDEALNLHRRSLAIYQEVGDRGGLATCLEGLGAVATAQGMLDASRHYFSRALEIATEIQFVPRTLSLLAHVGQLLLQGDKEQRAIEILSFVRHCPATQYEVKQKVQQLLESYDGKLSPAAFREAVRQGEGGTLQQYLTSLQIELASAEEPVMGDDGLNTDALLAAEQRFEPLTERELEILQLIAEGCSNREIAETLIIALGTVKAHNHHIYGKLGAKNRVEAVSRAKELNLL